MLELTRLQVVSTGEHDAVILGQLHTRQAQRIDTCYLLRTTVEYQVARSLLSIGTYTQQNQLTQMGICDVCIGQ